MARFFSHDEARKAGWFSRRHETPDAHRARSAFNKANWGRAGRIKRAQERAK